MQRPITTNPCPCGAHWLFYDANGKQIEDWVAATQASASAIVQEVNRVVKGGE